MDKVNVWNFQSQSVQGTRLFEDTVDRALATEATGAWEAGGPGNSSLFAASPMPYSNCCQRNKVNGAIHPMKEPTLSKDDTSLELMRSINCAYALSNE